MDKSNISLLNKIIGQCIQNIIYVHWVQEDVKFQCIEWIVLEFDNSFTLVFTTGDQGDNLCVYDYENYKPRKWLDDGGNTNVRDVYVNKSKDPEFSKFLTKKIIDYKLVPLEMYEGIKLYDKAVLLTTSVGKLEIGLKDYDNMRVQVI